MPVLAIVGRSGSGKTHLMVKLIKELKGRGLRLATVKHCHHDFDMDQEGKDSWQHRQAGASPVVVCTKSRLAIFLETETEMSLERIEARFLSEVDMILVEGYRSLPLPKVEVTEKGKKSELAEQGDPNLLAVISHERADCRVPLFLPDQVKELADFIYARLLPAGRCSPDLSRS